MVVHRGWTVSSYSPCCYWKVSIKVVGRSCLPYLSVAVAGAGSVSSLGS